MSHSSIGNMTNTLIETGARHMQQCRTNQDVLAAMCGSAASLADNDDAYCMGKDELAVTCGAQLFGNVAKTATKYAYPNVVTTLGSLTDQERWMMAQYYHTMGWLTPEDLKKEIVSGSFDPDEIKKFDTERTKQFRHFMPVGYSVGHACAHSRNGDTVASVQIGGLRTVLNGGFYVSTGDLIQMYIPEVEAAFFNGGGGRLQVDSASFAAKAPTFDTPAARTQTEKLRQNFYTRGQGTPGAPGSSKRLKTCMFSVKPYLESQNDGWIDYYGDKMRVFARAVSSARPWEPLDIMIARQSM